MTLNKGSQRTVENVIQFANELDVQENIQMKIDPSAYNQVLDRLTDLYSNPIAATVREILSNALDATVCMDEGDQKPIEVTTPNRIKPYFQVVDHGLGMSTDTVRSIYSQYGASTKSNDFIQTGAFGLGAKAPLAYCAEFNIETTHDGITTLFSIVRNTEGNFTRILSVEETGLESGTKVMIPVAQGDLHSFANHLNGYRYFFPTPIVINGETNFESPYLLLTDDFVLDSESGLTGKIWVRRDALGRAAHCNLARSAYERNAYSFTLSGWMYSSPDTETYSFTPSDPAELNSLYIFELKPGVVDFVSSRDEITENGRSKLLFTKCRSYIFDSNIDSLRKVFQASAHLDNNDINLFAKSLMAESIILTSDDIMLENTYLYTTQFPLKIFTNGNGYNPFILLAKKYSKNAIGGYIISSTDQKLKTLKISDKVALNNENHLLYKSSDLSIYQSVTEAKQTLMDQYSAPSTMSVAQIILSNYFARSLWFDKSIVVTQVEDDKMLRSVFTARNSLLKVDKFHKTAIIVARSTSVNSQIKLVEETDSSIQVQRMTAREFIALAKSHRPVKDHNVGDRPLKVVRITMGFEDELTILSHQIMSIAINLSPEEFRDTNALLILSDHQDWREAIIGASNDGVSIINRPIYLANRPSSLVSSHIALLETHIDRVISSSNYSHRLEKIQKIAAGVTHNGNVLASSLNNASSVEIIQAYMYNHFRHSFMRTLKAHVEENDSSNTAVIEVADLMSATVDNSYRSKFSSLRGMDITESDVIAKTGKEKAQVIQSLRKVSQEIRQVTLPEDRVFSIFLNSESYDSPVMKMLMKAFYQRVTDALALLQTV